LVRRGNDLICLEKDLISHGRRLIKSCAQLITLWETTY